MAALTEQLSTSLKYICSCNLTQYHITNGRWVCNPGDPTTILFCADIAGIGGTITNNVSQWAEQTNSVHLGTEILPVQGAMQCENKNCTISSMSPMGPSDLWIIGIVAGILTIIAVAAVIKWMTSWCAKLVWQLQFLSCILHYEVSTVKKKLHFPIRIPS